MENPQSLTTGSTLTSSFHPWLQTEVSPDGIINTVAGGGNFDLGEGGLAIGARIAVESITIDAAGNLYIAGYGRVRKVLPDGTITTVAGNGN